MRKLAVCVNFMSEPYRSRIEKAAAELIPTLHIDHGKAALTCRFRGKKEYKIRDLAVFAPGGVLWQPRVGDTVLVIRGGAGGLEHCVAAAEPTVKPPEGMSPGELYLYSSGGASIYLKGNGSVAVTGPVEMAGNLSVTGAVRLTGRVDISGSLYVNGEAYRPCRCG